MLFRKYGSAIVSLLLLLFPSSALALLCPGNAGHEQVILSGMVVRTELVRSPNATVSLGDTPLSRLHNDLSVMSVIEVDVDRVLKGAAREGDIVQVFVPQRWGGSRHIQTGPIVVGGRRKDDGTIWRLSCDITISAGSMEDLHREFDDELARIWHISQEYSAILGGRSPQDVSPGDRARLTALLDQIDDFDRLADFYRQRYVVERDLESAADYAFSLYKLGDIKKFDALMEELSIFYEGNPALTSIENTILMTEGKPWAYPARNLSALNFKKGLVITKADFSGQALVNVVTPNIYADKIKLSNSRILDFRARVGSIVDGDLRNSFISNMSLGSGGWGNNRDFPFIARRASFASAVVTELNLSGDFTLGVFRDLRGQKLSLVGDFDYANFDRARVDDVRLNYVSLRGASFRGAHFTNSRFDNVDLRGADLTGAIFDGEVNWTGIKYDEDTKMPVGGLPPPPKRKLHPYGPPGLPDIPLPVLRRNSIP